MRKTGDLPVPLHIRNAPTKLMKDIGYGKDYKYAHSYDGNFIQDNFMPEQIKEDIIYKPQGNSKETDILKRLQNQWKGKYNY